MNLFDTTSIITCGMLVATGISTTAPNSIRETDEIANLAFNASQINSFHTPGYGWTSSEPVAESSVVDIDIYPESADGIYMSFPISDDSDFGFGIKYDTFESTNVELASNGMSVSLPEHGEPATVIGEINTGVAIFNVFESAESLQAASFEVTENIELTEQPDGSIELAFSSQEDLGISYAFGRVESPWAVDANGAAVPTWYEVDGSTITQHLDTSGMHAAFPVVSNPAFSVDGVTFEGLWAVSMLVKFDRSHTATLAQAGVGGAGGIAATVCGGVGAVAGPAAGALAAAACGLIGAQIGYQAGLAQNSNPPKCVQVRLTQSLPAIASTWACKVSA